jgi:hypothetical protein
MELTISSRKRKVWMKKRLKQRGVSAFKSHQSATTSPESTLHEARTFPILECWISEQWKGGSGLVQILLARQQPNRKICCGSYLIDQYCLGLKDTFAKTNVSPDRYQELHEKMDSRQKMTTCPIELAHQMIYASLDYAAQFGFEPQSDWTQSQYLLEPRGELEEPYQLTFGKDGKPFFISGPYDNVEQIIKQLDKTAGPGNYDVVINLS